MRVIHQHTKQFTHNGATYNSPEWRVERLIFDYNLETVSVSLLIKDRVHVNLIDIEFNLPAITESNVILAIENWLSQQD